MSRSDPETGRTTNPMFALLHSVPIDEQFILDAWREIKPGDNDNDWGRQRIAREIITALAKRLSILCGEKNDEYIESQCMKSFNIQCRLDEEKRLPAVRLIMAHRTLSVRELTRKLKDAGMVSRTSDTPMFLHDILQCIQNC